MTLRSISDHQKTGMMVNKHQGNSYFIFQVEAKQNCVSYSVIENAKGKSKISFKILVAHPQPMQGREKKPKGYRGKSRAHRKGQNSNTYQMPQFFSIYLPNDGANRTLRRQKRHCNGDVITGSTSRTNRPFPLRRFCQSFCSICRRCGFPGNVRSLL